MKRAALVSLLLFVACSASDRSAGVVPVPAGVPAIAPAQWPAAWTTFHYSSQHTGMTTVKTPYHPHAVAPLWQYRTKSATGASAALGKGGIVYFGSTDGFLYALKPDGKLRWKYRAPVPVTTGVTLAPGGSLVYAAGETTVIAVTSAGKTAWRFKTGLAIIGTPTLSNDGATLYVTSFDHDLYALNAKTGKKLWSFVTGDGIDTTPTVDASGTIYFGSYDANFYAVSPAGAMLWKLNTQFLIESTAAVEKDSPNNLLFGNDLGLVFDVGSSGKVVGEVIVGAPIYTSVAFGPDGYGTIFGKKTALYHTFYVADWDGILHKYAYLDAALTTVNGVPLLAAVELWRFTTPLSFFSSPAVSADDHVYLGGNDGNYYEFDGDTGTLLAQYPVGSPIDASPAIGYDGTIYIGARNGALYAFH